MMLDTTQVIFGPPTDGRNLRMNENGAVFFLCRRAIANCAKRRINFPKSSLTKTQGKAERRHNRYFRQIAKHGTRWIRFFLLVLVHVMIYKNLMDYYLPGANATPVSIENSPISQEADKSDELFKMGRMKAGKPMLCQTTVKGQIWQLPTGIPCPIATASESKYPPHEQTISIYKRNLVQYKTKAYMCKIVHSQVETFT